MANSKEHKVRHAFIVSHISELRNERLNYETIFDLCWKQIPESLVKKLNSNELLEYINLHILPKVVAEQKSVLTSVIPKAYLNKNTKKHTMEVFA